jgi:hypothetical protein
MGVVPLNGVGLAMMSATGRRALLVIAAALVLGIANPARAELIYFSCSGTLETRGANSKQVEREPWTESLTFDTDKKTVKPASDDPLPVEVKDDSLVTEVGTRSAKFGAYYLMLNRITGQLHIQSRIIGDTEQWLFATCKRANKLF